MAKDSKKSAGKTKRNYKKKSSIGKSTKKKIDTIYKMVGTPEKKQFETSTYATVGQCNGNSDSGYAFSDITPSPTQGTGTGGRVGNQIHLQSMAIRGQMRQMANLHTSQTICIELFYVKHQVFSSATMVSSYLYKSDPISGYTDINSVRNADFYGDYTRLGVKYVHLPADNYSTMTNRLKDFKFNLKFKKPITIKWSSDSTSLANGQVIMVMRANTGNVSTVTNQSTSSNVANNTTSTGSYVNTNIRSWYTDD